MGRGGGGVRSSKQGGAKEGVRSRWMGLGDEVEWSFGL